MAICNAFVTGLDKSCLNNAGGVNRIFLTDFENVISTSISLNPAGNGFYISAITMVTSTKFYEVKTNKNTCSFTEDASIDLNTGSTFFTQVVNIVLSRRDTVKRHFIEKMTAGQKQMALIVLDSNGDYWYFGLVEGAYTTTISGGSGVAKSDVNGYNISITSMEVQQAFEVESSIISALIA